GVYRTAEGSHGRAPGPRESHALGAVDFPTQRVGPGVTAYPVDVRCLGLGIVRTVALGRSADSRPAGRAAGQRVSGCGDRPTADPLHSGRPPAAGDARGRAATQRVYQAQTRVLRWRGPVP